MTACPHCGQYMVVPETDRGLDVLHCVLCGWMVYDRTPIEDEERYIAAQRKRPRRPPPAAYLTEAVRMERKRFGALCRREMLLAGLTPYRLADLTATPLKSVWRVLNGDLGIPTMRKIGEYLGVWQWYRTYPTERCLIIVEWESLDEPATVSENPLQPPKVGVPGRF